MKEESTPYDGADSLKQICVLSTSQFTRFQLTEPICLLVSTRHSRIVSNGCHCCSHSYSQTFGKNSCGLLHISHERDSHPNVPSFMILSTKLHHRCDKWRHSTKKSCIIQQLLFDTIFLPTLVHFAHTAVKLHTNVFTLLVGVSFIMYQIMMFTAL